MSTITYNEVYSSFFRKVEAYDLLREDLEEAQKTDLLHEWLIQAISDPYVRRLFSSLELVDDDEENDITDSVVYNMAESVNESSDKLFTIEVLAYGVMIAWLSPKVNSLINIVQFIGTADEKMFSQASHLQQLRGLLEDVENRQRKLIRDRGYIWNEYINSYGGGS